MGSLPTGRSWGRRLSQDDFDYLTSFEWEALRRLEDMARIATVVAMLKDTPKRLQIVAIQDFVNRKLAELRRQD